MTCLRSVPYYVPDHKMACHQNQSFKFCYDEINKTFKFLKDNFNPTFNHYPAGNESD